MIVKTIKKHTGAINLPLNLQKPLTSRLMFSASTKVLTI